MSDLPPLPFDYESNRLANSKHEGAGHVWLLDANGKRIANIFGTGRQKMALVKLMIEASKQVKQ